MALPFVLLPLLVITSSKTWMTVREPCAEVEPAHPPAKAEEAPCAPQCPAPSDASATPDEAQETIGRFASHWTVVVLCWLIYALIVLCDGFVVVTSAMGHS